MNKSKKYAPEVIERAVRMVLECQDEHESQWSAIRSVAAKMGCNCDTLRRWVRQQEKDLGQRPGPTSIDMARIKELEREVKELRRANEILNVASAFFAQAKLDRRIKN